MSPCIKKCAYDKEIGHCTGCGRTLEEIAFWYKLTTEEKKIILKKCNKRLTDTKTSGIL